MGDFNPKNVNMPAENDGEGAVAESIDKKSLDEMNEHVSMQYTSKTELNAVRSMPPRAACDLANFRMLVFG